MVRTGLLAGAALAALLALAACGPTTPASAPTGPPTVAAAIPTATTAVVATATANPTATTAATSAPTAASAATSSSTVASTEAPSATETEAGFEPPNCTKGDCTTNGAAITQNLQGDSTSGAKIFANNCAVCHGDQGKGGVANPGSEDGTVPSLNPADDMFTKSDKAQFAKQLDLFIEHGSHTDGDKSMGAWGDTGALTPQQIADVIAYIISLNPQ